MWRRTYQDFVDESAPPTTWRQSAATAAASCSFTRVRRTLEPGSPAAPAVQAPVPPRDLAATGYAIMSVTFAPTTSLLAVALGGFGLELRGELQALPHVGIAVTGLGARFRDPLSDDVMLTVVGGGAQGHWYQHRFWGGYIGAAAAYYRGSNTAGTGFLGGEVEAASAQRIAATGMLGWKWLRPGGFTASLHLEVGAFVDPESASAEAVAGLSVHIGWSFGS